MSINLSKYSYHHYICLNMIHRLIRKLFTFTHYRSTSLRLVRPFVLVRSVVVTLPTRSPNTRPVKPPSSLKVSVVTTVSKLVMVVKPSPFSTRRPRLPKRLSYVWNVPFASTSINLS
jgi:hypothetical protein